MKNTKILEFSPMTMAGILKIPITVIALILMFGLAVTASAATLTRSLEVGSRGQDVSDLQTYLALDASVYPSGLVTGYFGQLTKAAVERFQANNGIVNSGTPATTGYGRVGPITMAALNQKMGGFTGNSSSPAIQSVNVSTSNNTVSLNWNTNRNASAIVYYSTSFPAMVEASPTSGVTIGGSSMLVHSDLRTSHSAVISSLVPNTTYYYVIYARDASGNENITWPSTFQTSN
ncbi:MAG: peptidoglycan-binding protein [Candidatus Paceibacterota bacterium]